MKNKQYYKMTVLEANNYQKKLYINILLFLKL